MGATKEGMPDDNIDLGSVFLLCCHDRTAAIILAQTAILFQGCIQSILDDGLA